MYNNYYTSIAPIMTQITIIILTEKKDELFI